MEQTATNSLLDAYAPAQIAMRVREVGVTKATMPVLTMFALAVLAGAFIALGALFFTITMTTGTTGQPPAFGLMRLAGGITFSLGLILVVVGGAEIFAGNKLIAMAWASDWVTTQQIMRNWGWAYLGNLAGAVGTAALWLAGIHSMSDGVVGETMVQIARSKIARGPVSDLARGVLCNMLVCLAVWLCMGARSVTDKILTIVFPITVLSRAGLNILSPTCTFFRSVWRSLRGPRHHFQSRMRSVISCW